MRRLDKTIADAGIDNIARMSNTYRASWALPAPGLQSKVKGHRHKNKNPTIDYWK